MTPRRPQCGLFEPKQGPPRTCRLRNELSRMSRCDDAAMSYIQYTIVC